MKRLIVLLILALVILFVIRGWWSLQLSAPSSDTKLKVFVIAKGENFSSVAGKLQQEGLIRSSLVLSIYGKQSGFADKISAGTFKLSSSMSAAEILEAISGNPVDSWVTLLEGWRVEEMAEKLNAELGVDKEQFIKAAKEGYSFPDTYLFPEDYTPEQIAKRLTDTFESRYSQDLRAKIRAQGLTEDEGVILASIVEREARSDKARTEIAGILLKRFNIGMGLNVDATLQYILGYQPQEKSWWKRHLSNADKLVESPYNTYKYKGLPPAPIANPSLSSLNAVANADSSTPYLYYYHDSQGRSHYGRTLEEHNANIANNP